MTTHQLAEWARTPAHCAGVLAVLAAVLAYSIRRVRRTPTRTPAAVVVAAFGAMLCTAYSGDTSWRFARDRLGMASGTERAVMFAAGEVALFAMALMARQNLRTLDAPGTPAVLVWVITGVQVIPAFSESGVIAGTVRAFFGPAMAAILWHLAMGIELRHTKPGADSQSLPAILVRELRERTLSRLGLSRRGRDAAQITRDRWTRIATQRAARLADLEAATSARAWRLARARRRLAVAVDRTDAGVLEAQRAVLLDRIAAARGAASLASMALPAPWERDTIQSAPRTEPAPADIEVQRVPEARPAIERRVPEPVPEPSEHAADQIARRMTGEPAPSAAYPEPDPTLNGWRMGAGGLEPVAEPDDDSPPPPGEDTLTAQARRDFLADLMDGGAPSIRTLRGRYAIGQDRAARIQTELKRVLA